MASRYRYPRERFEVMRKKYGDVASWAVWSPEQKTPKSGVGDLSIFDVETNDAILDEIHVNFVLVGLNVSRNVGAIPFSNFHSSDTRATDYKLRRAILGTPIYGAYMTDILKGLEEKEASKVASYIRKNPDILEKNVDEFRQEMADVGATQSTIIALGAHTESLLRQGLGKNEFKIVRLTHYASPTLSSERYRSETLQLIEQCKMAT